jgi:hypothetical protein
LSRILWRHCAAGENLLRELLARDLVEHDTPQGLAMRCRMWPVYARAIETHFDRHLTHSERTALRAVPKRVLDAPPDGA